MITCPSCDGDGFYGDQVYGYCECHECQGTGELTPAQLQSRALRLGALAARIVMQEVNR